MDEEKLNQIIKNQEIVIEILKKMANHIAPGAFVCDCDYDYICETCRLFGYKDE